MVEEKIGRVSSNGHFIYRKWIFRILHHYYHLIMAQLAPARELFIEIRK